MAESINYLKSIDKIKGIHEILTVSHPEIEKEYGTSSDNNYQIALLSLKQLLNLDTLNNFNISKPNVDVMNNELASLSVQNIYETALKNQHSIKAANFNVLAAEKSLDIAKGRISPTLSATGSLGTGTSELDKNIDAVNFVGYDQTPYFIADDINNPTVIAPVYQPKTELVTSKKPFADQFEDNVNKSIGFTLSVPIFNGLQTVTGVKNAKLNALNAKPRRPTKKHQPSFQEIRIPIKNDCIKGGLDDREQLPYPYAENKKAHH